MKLEQLFFVALRRLVANHLGFLQSIVVVVHFAKVSQRSAHQVPLPRLTEPLLECLDPVPCIEKLACCTVGSRPCLWVTKTVCCNSAFVAPA